MNAVYAADQVICLITAPSAAQALIWEEALRSEGIKFQVVGNFLGLGSGRHADIRPEIWIRCRDFIRAKHVLRQLESSPRGHRQ